MSNHYKSIYFNNHTGIAYRLKTENVKLAIGLEYQKAYLTGEEIYPQSFIIRKTFNNILPNFLLNVKSSRSSLRILYKTSTNAPSISQLQNVYNTADPTNLTIGNPNLGQEYSHNLKCNYSFANPDNSTSIIVYVAAEYDRNYIGQQTISDTSIDNIRLQKGIDLTRPINIDHASYIRSMIDYTFPVKWIGSKITFATGYNYSQTPGYINARLNRYTLNSFTDGLTVSSDISEDIDFTVAYTVNFSIIKNSFTTTYILNNPKYIYQMAEAKFNWIIWKGINFQNDVLYQVDKGFQNFNQNFVLWNSCLGKKLFKAQNAEIKLNVFDLLNKNINITHSVSPQNIQDARILALKRYWMLSIIYVFKDFKGQAQDETKKVKKSKKKDKVL